MMDNQIMFLETVRLLDRVSLRMKRVVLAREQVILK